MEFDLCYKKHPFKVTWDAKREFKRETGRGLWSTIQGILPIIKKHKDSSVWDTLHAIGTFIDDVDGAILLWVLAKQCNASVKLSEIADAVDKVGWAPIDDDNSYAQPYTLVLYDILHQLDAAYTVEAKQAKKDLCPSQEGQD